MKFTVEHQFNTSPEVYWNQIFFDAEYNARIYSEALDFKSFEMLALTGEPGQKRTRKLRSEPRSEVPAAIQKLIGDSISYLEEGVFDPTSGEWTYHITTSKMPDKIKIGGRLWVRPNDQGIVRYAEVDIQVKIFGIGGVIEKFIKSSTLESYEAVAKFTRQFIDEKQLSAPS